MQSISDSFRQKDFWQQENLRYAEPYFRLEKCARIISTLSRGAECELLDVGCGPATLARLLPRNVQYYGIDIALHQAAPNLAELDFAHNEICFGDLAFDLVVAAGVFEYLGICQAQKFEEIRRLLKRNGKFIVTYTNFRHLNDKRIDHTIYNNIQRIDDFKANLETYFQVDRWFPSSHNWFVSEPRRWLLKQIQLPLEFNVPLVSRLLAISYFFICSPRQAPSVHPNPPIRTVPGAGR